MASGISVVICDDHALVRTGLRRVLEAEPDFEVWGEAGSAGEALALVRTRHPDVLLLDVAMPGPSGIEAIPAIVEAAPSTRVVMLSMQDDPAYVGQALTAGASGYLLKDAADTELVQALHDVVGGHRYLQPLLGARLASAVTGAPARAIEDPLSEREHDVLRLLALGHTNREIADLLSVSVRTAESHRAQVVHKLGLKTRAEIVRYALETGVFDTEHASS
jgi:two-component system response regulator NreC